MREHICFYFILSFVLVWFNTTTAGGATNTCTDNERQALLGFKSRLLDPNDRLSTWRFEDEDDCCKWGGVTCDNQTGHVTMLDLSSYYIHGGEISVSLLNLTYLNHLDLSYCSFHGTIPRFIGSMTHLTYLDLSENEFTGTIPMSIGYLTNLTELHLDGNNLSGAIPESIGSLTKLTHLSLGSNNFSGIIPRSIGSLTKLTYLSLAHNSFHGTIPPEFGNLTNLETLSLRNLSGCTIENLDWLSSLSSLSSLLMERTSLAKANNWVDVIIGLQNLEVLSLSGCDLSKVMHPYSSIVNSSSSSIQSLYLNDNNLNSSSYQWLRLLVGNRVNDIRVSGNSFEGKLSDFLNNLSLNMLYLLDASDNQLTGSLSNDVSNIFMSVEYIDFSSNNLGPRFLKSIQKMKKLVHLDLSNNSISDTISTEYWNRWRPSKLRYLDLSNNNISGTLPDSLSSPDLEKVDLSSNSFYGPIPTLPPRISFLDLSRNSLTGKLPDSLKNLTYLNVLNLGHNTLSGYIPPFLGCLGQLETLSLRNNNFSGELPMSLKNCTNLSLLDFGANKLIGNIPVWIGKNFSSLYALSLKSNNFSGAIPSQICQLVSLQILDLSFNNLHGTIPSCVHNLTSMVQKGLFTRNTHHHYSSIINSAIGSYSDDSFYTDSLLIQWQGRVNEFSRTLGLVKTINLSNNNLQGKIPYELANLHGLLVLDLSHNALVGEIPRDIGQMTQLLTLNLSRNIFSGEIPSTMSQMDRLNDLDVSYNNLSGRVPSSTQLQSFPPERFIGNVGLCGLPTMKKCLGDEDDGFQHVDDSEGDAQSTEELQRWFYIGGATGFATTFWVSCSALLFNRRLRQAFFQLHEFLKDWVYVKVVVFMAKLRRGARG